MNWASNAGQPTNVTQCLVELDDGMTFNNISGGMMWNEKDMLVQFGGRENTHPWFIAHHVLYLPSYFLTQCILSLFLYEFTSDQMSDVESNCDRISNWPVNQLIRYAGVSLRLVVELQQNWWLMLCECDWECTDWNESIGMQYVVDWYRHIDWTCIALNWNITCPTYAMK